MTIKHTTDKYRIATKLDARKGKPQAYTLIRLTEKKNPKNTIDVPIYMPNGIRVKIIRDAFENGSVKRGFYSDEETTAINDRIVEIYLAVYNFIKQNPTTTNKLIQNHIYGSEFLNQHKKARTKEMHIEVKEPFYSEYFNKLRKQYPKRKEQVHFTRIDDEGFEVKEIKEVIIDPLDIITENYPHNFPKQLFNEIIEDQKLEEVFNSFPNGISPSGRNKEEWLKMAVALHFKHVAFSKPLTKEIVTIDNATIREFEKLNPDDIKSMTMRNWLGQFFIEEEDDLVKFKKQKEQKKVVDSNNSLPAKQRYEGGYYDPNNVFDVVGQILYLKKNKHKEFSKNWRMAVRKFFEYKSRANPTSDLRTITTIDWYVDFITYIKENGCSTAHPKGFDVFKYDDSIFIDSGVTFYQDISLKKFVKNVKEVLRYLIEQKKIPIVNLDSIKNEDFNLDDVVQDRKSTFYLTKPELDKLLFFEFEDCSYTRTFKEGDKERTSTKKYTGKELEQAKDLFILQTYFGGLRANELYDDNITILEDGLGNGNKKVHYFISKTKQIDNENPICSYSEIILKKYGYKYDQILIDYNDYCQRLKALAQQVFNREVVKIEQVNNKKTKNIVNINTEFESGFARKTFNMLLQNEGGISDTNNRKHYTGHKLSDVLKFYGDYNVEKKRVVMDNIKPEKPKK